MLLNFAENKFQGFLSPLLILKIFKVLNFKDFQGLEKGVLIFKGFKYYYKSSTVP